MLSCCRLALAFAIAATATAGDSGWKPLLDRLPDSLGAPAQPGLMGGPEDFERARQQILINPMSEWWSEENKIFAAKALATDLAAGCGEPQRSQFTRACAFVWRVEGKLEFRAKALEGVRAMARGGWSGAGKPWLDESEAVVQYAQALDLLREGGALD